VGRRVDLANGLSPAASVPNLVYRTPSGAAETTGRAALTPFDELPQELAPALYEADIAAYLPADAPVRQFALLTGLGCRYRCAFCINPVTGRSYRPRSARSIHREMRALTERHAVAFYVFQDEHFFADRRRVFDLLELIEGDPLLFGNIRWTTTVRVSDIRDDYLDVALLRRLARAGCAGLGTGGESGSDRVLRLLRKGTTRAQILRAARMANEARVMLSFSFVMLWPGESADDMTETARTIVELLSLGPYAHVPYFQTYRPYPGSAFEPDLSRFVDPERLPDDIWAFQSARPERFGHLPDGRRAFQVARTTQTLCEAAEGVRVARAPEDRRRHEQVMHACRRRILEGWPSHPGAIAC